MKKFLCSKTEPVVQVAQGKLRGFFFDGVYRFLGVPYAKARRFEMPEAPDAWEGTRNALAYGLICPVLKDLQVDDEIVVPHRIWPASEHCQNLNIWTNSLDAGAKKPVMVWFHGGGFFNGSAIEHIAYEGENLARYDDVVAVTINHRLNAFGHLDLSMFGKKYHNSVNAGIADLVASLRWVKENIASFGGDPDNVTIFGQSGGGGKVTACGQAPSCDGLFQKAIVMSGVFGGFRQQKPEADPKAFALEILRQLELTEKDVDRLQTVETPLFIMAVNRAVDRMQSEGFSVRWAPHSNDWYLGDPRVVGFREHYLTIPTMVGTVLAEFSPPVDYAKGALTQEEQIRKVYEKFGEENGRRLLPLYRQAYPGKPDIYLNDVDTGARGASMEYVRLKAKGPAPVYAYIMSSIFDYDGGRAAWHCADIPYVFHNSAIIPYCYATENRERLEKEMCGAFVQFARTGNPNHPQLPAWAPATPTDVSTMVFDDKTEARVNFDDELIRALQEASPAFTPHMPGRKKEG